MAVPQELSTERSRLRPVGTGRYVSRADAPLSDSVSALRGGTTMLTERGGMLIGGRPGLANPGWPGGDRHAAAPGTAASRWQGR